MCGRWYCGDDKCFIEGGLKVDVGAVIRLQLELDLEVVLQRVGHWGEL